METNELDDITCLHASATLTSAHIALKGVGEMVEYDRDEVARGDSTAAEMYDSALKLIEALDQQLFALQKHLADKFS